MPWTDSAKVTIEESLIPLKGKFFHCVHCGNSGQYDTEMEPYVSKITPWRTVQQDIRSAVVEMAFVCRDYAACQQRQANRGRK